LELFCNSWSVGFLGERLCSTKRSKKSCNAKLYFQKADGMELLIFSHDNTLFLSLFLLFIAALCLSYSCSPRKARTATVLKVLQIGLCGVVEADLDLFCNSCSAGFFGERLYNVPTPHHRLPW